MGEIGKEASSLNRSDCNGCVCGDSWGGMGKGIISGQVTCQEKEIQHNLAPVVWHSEHAQQCR